LRYEFPNWFSWCLEPVCARWRKLKSLMMLRNENVIWSSAFYTSHYTDWATWFSNGNIAVIHKYTDLLCMHSHRANIDEIFPPLNEHCLVGCVPEDSSWKQILKTVPEDSSSVTAVSTLKFFFSLWLKQNFLLRLYICIFNTRAGGSTRISLCLAT
jgi:hypothetical protein